ncbi:MAG: peptidoglycan-binding domain-containing protein [Pseudomonadota bacterium]
MRTPRKSAGTAKRKPTGGRATALPKFNLKAQHLWVLGSAALVGLAALNATVLQPGAHPAPLFEGDDAVGPSAMSVRPGPLADPNVRELQSRLKAMGLYDGDLDGLMGRRTLNAVYAVLDGDTAEPVAVSPTPAPRAAGGDALAALLTSSEPRKVGDAVTTPTVAKDAIVRLVQERLAERGFDPGPVDGVMGRATRSALGGFQASEGLAVSNAPDEATLAALGLSG